MTSLLSCPVGTVLFLAICLPLYGQQKKTEFPGNVDVSFNPLALFAEDPSLRLSSEWMGKGRWGYLLALGTGVNTRPAVGTIAENQSRYFMVEFRPEVKYYIHRSESLNFYMGIEALVLTRNSTLEDGSYRRGKDTEVSYATGKFRKQKIALASKIGFKWLIGRKLTIDLHTGLGFGLVNNDFHDLENAEAKAYDPFFDPRENFHLGRNLMPIMPMGIRLGYRVWQD